MSLFANLFTNRIIDLVTKKTIWGSSLATLSNAGYEAFQDDTYTELAPLVLAEGVETRITFDKNNLSFLEDGYMPRKGDTFYNLWDFDNNVMAVNKGSEGTIYSIRLQAIGKAATSAAGIGCEAIIRIPNDIAIVRRTYPLLKGNQNQRLYWDLQFYVSEEDVERGFELSLEPFGEQISLWGLNILIKSGD